MVSDLALYNARGGETCIDNAVSPTNPCAAEVPVPDTPKIQSSPDQVALGGARQISHRQQVAPEVRGCRRASIWSELACPRFGGQTPEIARENWRLDIAGAAEHPTT
jgi:hypothetical protein